MTDARDDDGEAAARERRCIVTRARAGAGEGAQLLRFALDPEGNVTPDLRGRLPGRGAWTLANAEVVAEAAAKGAFSRAFKRKALAGPGLAEEVERLMRADALRWLALANKAGLALPGAFKVEEALGKGRVAALLRAREAAPDGARKIDAKARMATKSAAETAPTGRADAIPVVASFGEEEIGLAFGRASVIHAALLKGGATAEFLRRAARLAAYRSPRGATAEFPTESDHEGGDDPAHREA
ncbi:MAG: RNA-binding protein [Hyphomicrobiales bacterium]|nr:RNA-binding protein [Hyphomicrobiales bacterium]